MNRRANTVAELEAAAARAPNDPALLVRCAVLLQQLGARPQSLALAGRAELLDIQSAAVNDALGALLTHHDEAARALVLATKAVRIAPHEVGFRFNLAMIQRMTGDFLAAEENLDRVIAARPEDAEAHLARSGLRQQTIERNHVDELGALVEMLKPHKRWIPAGFALAKEFEDLGEYERSFSVLSEACQAHRRSIRYDVAADIAVLEALCARHDRGVLTTVRSDFDNTESVFVLGLPRSGTTLVDRILGNHPSIYAAGELKAFPDAIVSAVSARSGAVSKLDFVQRGLEVDFAQVGPAYIRATRPRTGHTQRFTDKLPVNYLYAGLIHAALPRARFVALTRHPVDSCYAMYKTLFIGAYPFTYDLEDLGRYYIAWERLIRHWEEVLGEAWLKVDYEALVAEPVGISQRMVEHCGLEWHEDCLDFHRSHLPVGTASAVQVRRPIYTDSVDKWRHYERQLTPLIDKFEASGLLR